jgi:hypothetical protein
MKNKNRFLWISVAVALATVTLVIFLIPTGSRVHVVAEVEDNSVAIKSCALKKIFAINVLDPENTISTGNRAIYMRIFYNQTEILETP